MLEKHKEREHDWFYCPICKNPMKGLRSHLIKSHKLKENEVLKHMENKEKVPEEVVRIATADVAHQ